MSLKRLIVLVFLLAGCGSSVPASASPSLTRPPTPRPTVASVTPPTPGPTPTPEATEAPKPPDKALVSLAPKSVRAACESIDLSDAAREIDCSTGGVDFYLTRWSSVAQVKTALADEFEVDGCAALDRARGDWLVGKTRVGQGGGCVDSADFAFTNERDHLFGMVTVDGGTLADSQAWFKHNGPIGKGLSGKITGDAVGPILREASWATLVAHAKKVAYKTFFRNSSDYEGRLVYFKAKVLQVTDEGLLVEVTKDRYGFWDDLVFVTYSPFKRVLEDDIVEFVGTGAGIYTYTTVLGVDKDVPQVDALELRIR